MTKTKTKPSKTKLLAADNLDKYQAAGGDVHSSENQRVLDQLVRREVVCCVSSLIHHFATHTEALEGSGFEFEDLMAICGQDDWESSVREHDDFLKFDSTDDCVTVKVDGAEQEFNSWQDAAEAIGIDDPQTHEAYEHWIVSDWFAARLKEHGEMTTTDFFNLTIWGRCTTGQSISMDGITARVAADMEILAGQKNDWSKT